MSKVTLQFQTPQDLTGFRTSVTTKTVKVDVTKLTLTCECSDLDVALAMNSFGARVIDEHKKR